MPTWLAVSFQDNVSPSMEHILFFHDHAMIVLILITVLTFYLMVSLSVSSKTNKYITEDQSLETIWTILPAVLLIFIALPSLKTLYLMEDTNHPQANVKVVGHQWYWSYEYTYLNKIETDNFMENSNILRLLKTSEMLYLPQKFLVRTLVTSGDVIHSWAVPSMGVKVDALPGRLNQTFVVSKRVGLYTGQCSEICGTNHSFMPILIKVLSPKRWVCQMNNM